jgi:hypothetical protein
MSGSAIYPSNYPIDPAYNRTPSTLLLRHIAELQKDGLLLLDHLAKRPTRRFTQDNGTGGQPKGATGDQPKATAGNGSDLNISIEPLQLSAAQVAESKEKFRELVCLVDELARLAYPATPRSIEKSRARHGLSDWMLLILMLAALLLAVMGLWKADEGRKLVVDARAIQVQTQPIFASLALLETGTHFDRMNCEADKPAADCQKASGEQAKSQLPVFCEPEKAEKIEKQHHYWRPLTLDALRLCGALKEQRLREQLVFARLRGWNCDIADTGFILGDILLRLFSNMNEKNLDPINPRTGFTKCELPSSPNQVNQQDPTDQQENQSQKAPTAQRENQRQQYLAHWQRSELRAIPVLHLISQHLLPAILAMLGASISLLLGRYRARNTETLRDGFLSTLALIIMPTTLGALIGLVWGSAPDPVAIHQIKIGDFSFNLGVIAFFMGFVFQDVLDWLGTKIRKLLDEDTKDRKINLKT